VLLFKTNMDQRNKQGLSAEIRTLLKNYSGEELEELFSNQPDLLDLMQMLPCVQGLEKSVELMVEENEKLAGEFHV
jgi:hypothetical protein